MKIYPKQLKRARGSGDFYFGDYGEFPLAISASTINEVGKVDDKFHYHKNGYEFYLNTQRCGLLEIEGIDVELNQDILITVVP